MIVKSPFNPCLLSQGSAVSADECVLPVLPCVGGRAAHSNEMKIEMIFNNKIHCSQLLKMLFCYNSMARLE